MRSEAVREFFDALAADWDSHLEVNERVIGKILDQAGVSAGKDVCDIGCGTGVLFPFYQKRNVASLTAVDLSPAMCAIAEKKADAHTRVICADASELSFPDSFDVVMIYNAFPHFSDRRALFQQISRNLKADGVFSIAHGMSREKLLRHHDNVPADVSTLLPEVQDLAKEASEYFDIFYTVSDAERYQLCGRKK
ncbi:MAG: class I SAM-dependent methyltransferase [Erysipelotrichaceae bacterium]|nr:class I SAM-dependent methyltransferase [Erysipelotrichaceae bacterium]